MRQLVFLGVALLFSGPLRSQHLPDSRFRAGIEVVSGISAQAFNEGSRTLAGCSNTSAGAYLSMARPLYQGVALGFFGGYEVQGIHGNAVRQYVAERYGVTNQYLSVLSASHYSVWRMGAEVFRPFPLRRSRSLDPFLRIGLGSMSDFQDVQVRIKERDDNYFEEYTLVIRPQHRFNAAYYVVGVRAILPLSYLTYVRLSFSYTATNFHYTLEEDGSNLTNQKWNRQEKQSYLLGTFQLGLGFDFRFGRRKFTGNR